MQKLSVPAMAREPPERARAAGGGRAATVIGGHQRVLRQTVIALIGGAALAEHENPGEASVCALAGRVRLSAGESSWEGRPDDLLVVLDSAHALEAREDASVLLTVARPQ
jgi:quercetin dioxygenase-like cupin family protein